MIQELTKAELEIMKIFWRSKTPLTRKEVALLTTKIKPNSVNPMIHNLLAKDWIEPAGRVYSSTTSSLSFKPKRKFYDYLCTIIECPDVPGIMIALSTELGNEENIDLVMNALLEQKSKIHDFIHSDDQDDLKQ